jgi:hypothetical protein
MEWRLPTPKEVLVVLLCAFALWSVKSTWEWALAAAPVAKYDSKYEHAWRIKGRVRWADHISTSMPGYLGTPGFSTTGWNELDVPIWTVDGCTELEQIR